MGRVKKENLKLRAEELKKKYGDKKIMVVGADIVSGIKEGYCPKEEAPPAIRHKITSNIVPMLRWEAEINPSFKQPIPYVVLIQIGTNKVFAMRRVGGDERLLGGISIGVGGHVDDTNEGLYDAMYREIKEEVGLSQNNIFSCNFMGYILDNSTAVNSVHLGMVFVALIDSQEKVECLEKDKLVGAWLTIDELGLHRNSGELESWSEIIFDNAISGRAGHS